MQKKGYLLLDNNNYLEYYLSRLKDKYIPITTDIYIDSYLKAGNISVINIFNYLADKDIKAITDEASLLVDNAVTYFNESNRRLYGQVLNTGKVNLVYASMNYLFKRFVIGGFKLIKALEVITQREKINKLYYLHSGNPVDICGNRMQNAFFFPDDVIFRLLESWDYAVKPDVSFLKVEQQIEDYFGSDRGHLWARIREIIKVPLRSTRDLFGSFKQALPPYSPHKKNLLFLSPFYDLGFVLSSREMKRKYNIIVWHADSELCPRFLKDQPRSRFFSDKTQQDSTGGYHYEQFLGDFNFSNPFFKRRPGINIKLDRFLTPLIKRFLEKKIPRILAYWKAAEQLHSRTRIDMLFWGGSPHRFPGGIVKEFFRIKGIPIFGSQHGGIFGSNDMGWTIFDLDFNHCDYYYTYGFDSSCLGNARSDDRKLPTMIPVGSVSISDFARQYNLSKRRREKVDILWPIAVTNDNIFLGYENSLPHLYDFQKRIIEILAGFANLRIILKFLNSYRRHYLNPYIESHYPGRFRIIDCIPYRKCLELYDSRFIIIEQQSTPLNESLVTKSNIIVYNDELFGRLTEEAYAFLAKRAFVCNTKESFLKTIKGLMGGNIGFRDLEDRRFLEKYCIYKGLPQENIMKAISDFSKRG